MKHDIELQSSYNNKPNIIVFGQVPPPNHGQAIMIEKLLNNKYDKINLIHIRLDFSETFDEIGKFELIKLIKLFRIILIYLKQIILNKIDLIYYPPAGNQKSAILRDFIILNVIHLTQKKVVFHFHAFGLIDGLNKFLRFKTIFSSVYYHPRACIFLSNLNLELQTFFNAEKNYVLPYGIEDIYSRDYRDQIRKESNGLNILFMGNLIISKGILILLDAINSILNENSYKIKVQIGGEFPDMETKKRVEEHPLFNTEIVQYNGGLKDKIKWDSFFDNNLFCFPTFYESENFPVVLIEAMQFGLPIITSRWRSIPTMVVEDENALLVEPNDIKSLKEKIIILYNNSEKRNLMGINSRKIYENKYTLNKYLAGFENIMIDLTR